MSKVKKIMTSMKFRDELTRSIEDVRFRDTEVIVLHYAEPVAKLIKISEEEAEQVKKKLDDMSQQCDDNSTADR